MTANSKDEKLPTLTKLLETQEQFLELAGVEGLEPPTPGFGDRGGSSPHIIWCAKPCEFIGLPAARCAMRSCGVPVGLREFGSKIGSKLRASPGELVTHCGDQFRKGLCAAYDNCRAGPTVPGGAITSLCRNGKLLKP